MKWYNKKLDWLFACCRKCQAQQCFCPSLWTSPGGVGWREMRSVMEASLLLYLRIIACPYLRFLQSASAPIADTPQTCALFCTHQKLNSFVFNRFRTLWPKHSGGRGTPPLCHEEIPFEGEENRVVRPAESAELRMSRWLSITIRNCLGYDLRQDVSASRILLQERPKSLRPAFEILRSAKGNNYGENLFRRRRHHRSFRIARRAAVRPDG